MYSRIGRCGERIAGSADLKSRLAPGTRILQERNVEGARSLFFDAFRFRVFYDTNDLDLDTQEVGIGLEIPLRGMFFLKGR